MKVVVMLPAYNEAEALSDVIDEIRRLGILCEIWVVDSNSNDGTPQIALGKGVRLIRDGRGKGAAIIHGLSQIQEVDYLAMMDSDFTYPAGALPGMLCMLVDGRYNAVMGNRLGLGSMSKLNWFGNRVLSLMASILYGMRVRDLCTGMWLFDRGSVDVLRRGLVSKGFTLEADIFTNLRKRGFKIGQYPVEYRRRLGESKLKIWDGFLIGWFLIKRRFSE